MKIANKAVWVASLFLLATHLLGCSQVPRKTSSPKELVENALSRLRLQGSYETRFTIEQIAPNRAEWESEGRSLWIAPAVFYLECKVAGSGLNRTVGAGTRTVWRCHNDRGSPGFCPRCGVERKARPIPHMWTYSPAGVWWLAGAGGVPTGLPWYQDVDGLLSSLLEHLEGARLPAPGVVELTVTGAAVEHLLLEKVMEDWRAWEHSTAAFRVTVGKEGDLESISWYEKPQNGDSKKGEIRYRGQMRVVSRNVLRELKFRDRQGKVIPLDDSMKVSIEKALSVPLIEGVENLQRFRERLKSHFVLDRYGDLVPVGWRPPVRPPEPPEVDLLTEADRLWPIDDEASILLYDQLLTEYENTEVVRWNWTRIRKRAEQKD